MGTVNWLFGIDGNALKEEPRLPSEELKKGYSEINERIAAEKERQRKAEEERLRRQREAEEERIRKQKEAGNKQNRDVRFSTTGGSDTRYSFVSDVGRYSLAAQNYPSVNESVEPEKSFGKMLVRYVNERCDGRSSECYQRAGISRQLYSRIISEPGKNVAKRTALQLCIGLKLDRKQAVEFLSFAGYAFSPSSFEDTAFSWCLEHGAYSMFDVNDLLVLGGVEPISLN